jgi:hypothetical protein
MHLPECGPGFSTSDPFPPSNTMLDKITFLKFCNLSSVTFFLLLAFRERADFKQVSGCIRPFLATNPSPP